LRARRFRSTLLPVRICSAPALVLSLIPLLACSTKEGEVTTAPSASAGPIPTWSRPAFAPSATGPLDLNPTTSPGVDPAALDELIAAAPKTARRPTGKDGGTAIGHDIELSAEAIPPVLSTAAPAPGKPRVVVGAPTVQPAMASPAIERAARAQLYWNLVQRCRDPEGHILPPEVIRLQFHIDVDGYIVASTIVATPRAARFADAAHCMQRELSTAAFQAPASTRGRDCAVDATVPSVD
jgi:hypothetical protein